eukprot:5368395-Pyramimonas_sp.AAC.1
MPPRPLRTPTLPLQKQSARETKTKQGSGGSQEWGSIGGRSGRRPKPVGCPAGPAIEHDSLRTSRGAARGVVVGHQRRLVGEDQVLIHTEDVPLSRVRA